MKQMIFLLTLLSLTALTTKAATYKVGQGAVEFTAKGFPTFITIGGKSPKVMGSLRMEQDMVSGTFKLPLNTLKTGMELRDDHMINKYLEAPKYPQAALTLRPFVLKDEGVTTGTLSLHNVEKDIEIEYTSSKSENALMVETKFQLVLSDFNIDIPSFQGITVAKDIKLKVDFKAMKEN